MKIVISKKAGKWVYTTENKKTRVCRNCNTQEEAEEFVKKLKYVNQYEIREIAQNMFIPDSEHCQRLALYGKKLAPATLTQKRKIAELIMKQFGDRDIQKLEISEIQSYLLRDRQHSGSWKNFFLDTLSEIYSETIWKCSKPVPKPQFQRFARNSKKANILTTEELKAFFQPENWNEYQDYLFFLVTASCGLRLGEARALQVRQFLFDKKTVVVDGFCLANGKRTNYNKKGSAADPKIRAVPLAANIQKLVSSFIAEHKLLPTDYLFSRHEKVVRAEYAENLFRKQLEKSGIRLNGRKLVPHSLRYTYVTRMRRSLSAEQVQKLVGHSSVTMTEYYTRSSLEEIISSATIARPAAESLFQSAAM